MHQVNRIRIANVCVLKEIKVKVIGGSKLNKITITNLKDVCNLEFEIPTTKGVYLIAGSNGSGKTTLLACLDRICNSNAFATGLSSTSQWAGVDNYDNASVQYDAGGKTVSYRRARARWVPTPKKGSMFLRNFGFSASYFIKADAQRIAVKQEDLKPGNMATVDAEVKKVLNTIFETDKYDSLKRLKNTNGRGKTATYFYVIQEGNGQNSSYYSEKRFSTGELAVLRLVEKVEQVENGSMILLDEAELALHPRVQVKLLEYLKVKAEQNNLWVFISTHSPAMLKEIDRDHILLLRKTEGKTEVVMPCYPAQAIGEVDFARSNIFDYIFFVEDEKALEILRNIIKRFKRIKSEHASALVEIVPVGGYFETSRLAVNTSERLFGKSVVRAVVDADAFEKLDENHLFNELYKNHKEIIKSLTFTPEMWLMEKMKTANQPLSKQIYETYSVEVGDLFRSGIFDRLEIDDADSERKVSKKQFKAILDYLSMVNCRDAKKIEAELVSLVVDSLTEGEILGVAGPLFSARG